MSDSRMALDMDRLPWLTDERKPKRNNDWSPVLLWALAAAVLIAGVSYWLGMKSVGESDPFADSFRSTPPAATIRLPEPAIIPPSAQHEIKPAPMQEVEPLTAPAPIKIAPAEPVRRTKADPGRAAPKIQARPVTKAQVKKPATKAPARLQYWPAMESTGANGRIVRIGTFGSRQQAKRGWRQIVRHYPGMLRLKAVVAPAPSLRNGRTYYRLQFGTTSQAHSEILCQRMRMIAQSCVVIGLGQGKR